MEQNTFLFITRHKAFPYTENENENGNIFIFVGCVFVGYALTRQQLYSTWYLVAKTKKFFISIGGVKSHSFGAHPLQYQYRGGTTCK